MKIPDHGPKLPERGIDLIINQKLFKVIYFLVPYVYGCIAYIFKLALALRGEWAIKNNSLCGTFK
jgi:hypothetical protein